MAASLLARCINTPNTLLNLLKCRLPAVSAKRNYRVVMTDDSSTVVCWHPEEKFPYEKSLPIPQKLATPTSDSVLKVQSTKEFLELLRPKKKSYVIGQLSKMTYTCKHVWYPPGREVRRQKKCPPWNRPYL